MRKRFLSILTTMCLICSNIPTTVYGAAQDTQYLTDDDGTYEIRDIYSKAVGAF